MNIGTDPELWQLSRRAVQDDQLLGIIGSCSSWQIPAVLGATCTGRDLLAELHAYDRRQRRGAGGGTLGAEDDQARTRRADQQWCAS